MTINGFCISYIGKTNEITMGWYKNNLREGNFLSIDGEDFSVI